MSKEIGDHQQNAMEQKINEMVQQSRILEAYMNDIITRETTVTRLMEEGRLASSAVQNITDVSEVESLMPVGIGVYKSISTTCKEITGKCRSRSNYRKKQAKYSQLY